ncbi:hypothetical protein LXJ15735_37820 [Lacrimispora xylanolytica]
MDVKDKLHKLSFEKNQMMKDGPQNIEDVEPTICQILEDIFGIGSEYTKKANKIHGGFIVPSSAKLMYGQASKEQYYKEKFEMYMKLILQAEAYISVDEYESSFPDVKEEQQKAFTSPRIFLSYCWANTDSANVIDDYLKEKGITVTRDVRGVDNWQSLKEFMQTIRDNDFAVLLISDAYLKSTNCMYEVLEVMKEKKYQTRIFPAVIDSIIYSTDKQFEYVRYWQDRVKTLKLNLSSLEYTNGLALGHELKKAEDISRTIAEFLVTVSDMKNPAINNINDAIYEKLRFLNYGI